MKKYKLKEEIVPDSVCGMGLALGVGIGTGSIRKETARQ